MVIDESRLMTRSEEPGWISLLDATKMEERLCALRMAICGAGLLALLIASGSNVIAGRTAMIGFGLVAIDAAATGLVWGVARRKQLKPLWWYAQNTVDVTVVSALLVAVLSEPAPSPSVAAVAASGYLVLIFAASIRIHAMSSIYATALSMTQLVGIAVWANLSGTAARAAAVQEMARAPMVILSVISLAMVGGLAAMMTWRTRRALAALQEADRRQARALQLVRDGLVMCDAEQRVVEVNASAVDLLHLPRTNLVGLHAAAAMPPAIAVALDEAWDEILVGGAWVRDDVQITASDGARVWLSVCGQRILYQDQPVVQLAFHDVSAEHELRDGSAQNDKFQALLALTTGVAHEFNNVLATIEASSFILSEAVSKTSAEYTEVEAIRSATARATRFVSELLDIADMRAPAARTLDLAALIRKVAQSHDVEGNPVHLELHVPEKLPAVRGDEGQLERALDNLISYGYRAMLDGGTLTVEARERTIASGHARLAPGRYVELRTRDTGLGMPSEVTAHAFDVLSQPDISTDATGAVRLATVRATVERHGGTIRIESSVGHGTSFEVLIPASPAAEPERASEPSSAARKTATRRLLVVDDEPANRTSLARLLSFRGYEVLLAEDGMAAIRLVEDQGDRIDLVLLDLLMPEMNGKEVLTALRERRPNLKILLVTGYAEQALVQEALDLGAVGVTYKPFDVPALLEQVQQLTQN